MKERQRILLQKDKESVADKAIQKTINKTAELDIPVKRRVRWRILDLRFKRKWDEEWLELEIRSRAIKEVAGLFEIVSVKSKPLTAAGEDIILYYKFDFFLQWNIC